MIKTALPPSLTRFICCLYLVAALVVPNGGHSAPPVATSLKMRPYTGIGILMLSAPDASGKDYNAPLVLYEEPGLDRKGELDSIALPRQEWIFGSGSAVVPLVVMARKAGWLKVVYDEAGREAWINPGRRGVFQPWDVFFKGQTGRMLPGLQKKYYQLFVKAGSLPPLGSIAPQQTFKLILLEDDWAAVMPDPTTLNWIRWRDEDGRILIGLDRGPIPAKMLP